MASLIDPFVHVGVNVAHRQTGRKTDRQTGKQADRLTDGRTDGSGSPQPCVCARVRGPAVSCSGRGEAVRERHGNTPAHVSFHRNVYQHRSVRDARSVKHSAPTRTGPLAV